MRGGLGSAAENGSMPEQARSDPKNLANRNMTTLARLSYLAVYPFWILVETPRNRPEIDRNRFVPVCGRRPGNFGLGVVSFGGRFGSQIDDSRPDS